MKIRVAVGKKVPIPGVNFSSIEGRVEMEADVEASNAEAATRYCASLFELAETAVNSHLRGELVHHGALADGDA